MPPASRRGCQARPEAPRTDTAGYEVRVWRAIVLGLLVAGCATVGQRVDVLFRDAASCTSFSDFEARAASVAEALPAGDPEKKADAEARIDAAREACARSALSGLWRLREAGGADAVQRELNALTRVFSDARVDALLVATPGLDLASLRPMLSEAREQKARAATEAGWALRAEAPSPPDDVEEDDARTLSEARRGADATWAGAMPPAPSDAADSQALRDARRGADETWKATDGAAASTDARATARALGDARHDVADSRALRDARRGADETWKATDGAAAWADSAATARVLEDARRDAAETWQRMNAAPQPTEAESSERVSPTCRDVDACAEAHCLAKGVRATPATATEAALREAARRCLEGASGRPVESRVDGLSRLLVDMSVIAGSPEARQAREALAALWPERRSRVREALEEKQPGRAWALARPFESLDVASTEVEAARKAAVAQALAHAAACGPRLLCAALHRHVAAEAAGDTLPSLQPASGLWRSGRWRCGTPQPSLPSPPPGLTARLDATCLQAPPPKPKGDETPTFELEASMQANALEGEVRADCGGRQAIATFRVPGFASTAVAGEGVRLLREAVEHAVARVADECRVFVDAAARQACATLEGGVSRDAEERLTRAAVARGAWAPCFEAYFVRHYGVPPPALR